MQAEISKDAAFLRETIGKGFEHFQIAGKFIADKIDDDPTWVNRIAAECPELRPEFLRLLAKIGRGTPVRLALAPDHLPGIRKLLKAPVETQNRYLDDPIPVLVPAGEGWDTLLIKAKDLSSEQSDQVFDRDGDVRTIEAQRAYIASKATKDRANAVAPAFEVPYSIVNGFLVVTKPVRLSKRDLKKLLETM